MRSQGCFVRDENRVAYSKVAAPVRIEKPNME